MEKNTKVDFSDQDIYVDIDTGKKSQKVSVQTKEPEQKTFGQPPIPGVLVQYLHRRFPGTKYQCVYEAAYFGSGFMTRSGDKERGVW